MNILGEEAVIKHLTYICEQENVTHEEGAIKALVDISEGDLRSAITTLQSVSRLNGTEPVTEEGILEITGWLSIFTKLL